MERTVWTIVAALSLGTGVGCKDSNQNYIGFDALTTDVKADLPATDTKAVAPAPDGQASDMTTDAGQADSGDARLDGGASVDGADSDAEQE